MLAAGLDGIEKGMTLPPEASNNIYEMTEAERAEAGIGSLPEDLYNAIKCFEESTFVREALGDHVCDFLVRNKWEEWDDYKTLVTPYELSRYLPIL
jgi:glutamine synthetase